MEPLVLLELGVLGEVLLANRADRAAVPANVRLDVAEEVAVTECKIPVKPKTILFKARE